MNAEPAGAKGRVGVVERRGRFTAVEPFFERGRRITVDVRRRRDVDTGDLVLVRFARNGARPGRPLAGAAGHSARRDRRVPARPRLRARLFGGRRAGGGRRGGSPDSSARRDLTSLATFTIDPASARDFDDAISAERDGDGVRLSVHIADVGAFVPAGSATDREASVSRQQRLRAGHGRADAPRGALERCMLARARACRGGP